MWKKRRIFQKRKKRKKSINLPIIRPTAEEIKKSIEWKKSLCSHGPNGKCLNCAGVTGEEVRRGVYEDKCDHPVGGKCNKCLNRGFIKDV